MQYLNLALSWGFVESSYELGRRQLVCKTLGKARSAWRNLNPGQRGKVDFFFVIFNLFHTHTHKHTHPILMLAMMEAVKWTHNPVSHIGGRNSVTGVITTAS